MASLITSSTILIDACSRGKKIFRRFSDDDRPEGSREDAHSATSSITGTPEQRRLKRQAGVAAQRPLTRSAIKPKLLFPSEEQIREREAEEEAVTDIDVEMTNAESPRKGQAKQDQVITPVNAKFKDVPSALVSPPTTVKRSTRSRRAEAPPAIFEDAEEIVEPVSVGSTADADAPFTSTHTGKRKTNSPFDSWQRTKAGRKRAGSVEEGGSVGGGKKSRSAVSGSPA